MTIDDLFRRKVKEQGGVVVMAGSPSDKPHVDKLVAELEKFGIPYAAEFASAHKQPHRVLGLQRAYDHLDGNIVYIAVAGGTDALSGTLSWHTTNPVISSPPETSKKPREHNMSCIGNPDGSSNGYVGRPHNVARLAAQILTHTDPSYTGAIEDLKSKKITDSDKSGKLLKVVYAKRQEGD